MVGNSHVSALLVVTDTQLGSHYPCYDSNGNIIAMVNAATKAISAQYEYSPFGETTRATGPFAEANPYRFSTKPTDSETGLIYYGYRFYKPKWQTWPSRDPIGEEGGINLYGFVGNDGVNRWDILGHEAYSTAVSATLAAASKIFQLTKQSREDGLKEWGEFFNSNSNWKQHADFIHEINYSSKRAKNFNIYLNPGLSIASAGYVDIIFGVEHAIAVFCCPDTNDFQLSDVNRGFFPGQDEYWKDHIAGHVNSDTKSPCEGGFKISKLHTHNFGVAIVRNNGLEDFRLGDLYPSTQDLSNKEDGVISFVVGEFWGRMTLVPY